ncbi:MAG TPA: hypothetical protein VJI68_00105 [Candidatus Nanoarchaeia archaeon]|nr:hypothetical protein [Candidatus Nanoarchaeia archaeon]
MNKKGIFFPLFVFITIFLLLTMLYVVNDEESEKNDLIGLKAVNIIKLQDETEKIQSYLDLSTKYAANEALKKLAANGGYSEGRCKKTQKDLINTEEYIILETCPELNINNEFNSQLKEEIKQYIKIYETSYIEADLEKYYGLGIYDYVSSLTKPEELTFNKQYTEKVRETNVLEIKDSVVYFSEIDLQIENTTDSFIKLSPKIKLQKQNFEIYNELYLEIKENCLQKETTKCEGSLKIEFPEITIEVENELVKINLPSKLGKIRLAFKEYKKPS